MKQAQPQPSAQPSGLTRRTPPWADRAIGAAAAAVFLAGIVSAGLVDSEGGPAGPTLAAPASASTAKRGSSLRPFDQSSLTTATPSSGSRAGTSAATNAARGLTSGDVARGGAGPSSPSTPAPAPSPAPPGGGGAGTAGSSGSGDQVPAGADPTPSVGVAVGPIAIGADSTGAGGTIDGTTVGDPSAAPDQSGTVTAEVDPGIAPPVIISAP